MRWIVESTQKSTRALWPSLSSAASAAPISSPSVTRKTPANLARACAYAAQPERATARVRVAPASVSCESSQQRRITPAPPAMTCRS
eukprot:846202-Prymnesium_polylepis.1